MFNVRMRSSRQRGEKGVHVSGTERIVKEDEVAHTVERLEEVRARELACESLCGEGVPRRTAERTPETLLGR